MKKSFSLQKRWNNMKDFKFTITIKEASPEDIYNALTNPFAIELWSGYPAVMKLEEGAEFSLWEGDITGRVLAFEKDKKLVQEWFFGDNTEPSVATIDIFSQKKNKSYVVLNHTNIPKDDYDNIVEGWTDFYLGAIKKFFEEE